MGIGEEDASKRGKRERLASGRDAGLRRRVAGRWVSLRERDGELCPYETQTVGWGRGCMPQVGALHNSGWDSQ